MKGSPADHINLDDLQRLGHLSQADAQGLHTILCHTNGIKDPDLIIADWNRRSPKAPWDCPPDQCTGPYVEKLTNLVLQFMQDKLSVHVAQATQPLNLPSRHQDETPP